MKNRLFVFHQTIEINSNKGINQDMWCVARFGTICTIKKRENPHGGVLLSEPATVLKVTLRQIVQMVQNRATHHIYLRSWGRFQDLDLQNSSF